MGGPGRGKGRAKTGFLRAYPSLKKTHPEGDNRTGRLGAYGSFGGCEEVREDKSTLLGDEGVAKKQKLCHLTFTLFRWGEGWGPG